MSQDIYTWTSQRNWGKQSWRQHVETTMFKRRRRVALRHEVCGNLACYIPASRGRHCTATTSNDKINVRVTFNVASSNRFFIPLVSGSILRKSNLFIIHYDMRARSYMHICYYANVVIGQTIIFFDWTHSRFCGAKAKCPLEAIFTLPSCPF